MYLNTGDGYLRSRERESDRESKEGSTRVARDVSQHVTAACIKAGTASGWRSQ
jgi:hypothetical protein